MFRLRGSINNGQLDPDLFQIDPSFYLLFPICDVQSWNPGWSWCCFKVAEFSFWLAYTRESLRARAHTAQIGIWIAMFTDWWLFSPISYNVEALPKETHAKYGYC